MPQRPFVLVGQQYLADPGRSVGDVHPVWAYAHVPAGYTGDATEAILAQIERFAPGTAPGSEPRHRGHPPRWRGTTPTTSEATSPPGRITSASCCFGRGPPCTRTGRACPASTCAPRRRHRAPAYTACAATMPPGPRWPTSADRISPPADRGT
jgi:hypothetical protein